MKQSAVTTTSNRQQRAFWLKHLHQWHWISAAISLVAMLLFAATGITLNHAAQIEARPKVESHQAQLPDAMLERLTQLGLEGEHALPQDLQDWLSQQFPLKLGQRLGEWSKEEIYVALPRPGGDAWLNIDLLSGEIEYEVTERGWVSYFNDLHKGRHTGVAWSWFIDLFAVASLIFGISGLFLLHLYGGNRPATWPLVGLGVVIPVVLLVLFVH